jgi:hypothetical protein
MRSLAFFLLPFFCFAGINEDLSEGPFIADEITDEWLTQTAVAKHDTQHVLVFKALFDKTRVKTLLEFGLGYPTKYFLERCNKVISVDIITHGYGPAVMQKFLKIYADYSNWIPIAFFSGYLGWDYAWAPYKHLGSDSVYKATSYQHAFHKNYAKLDDFYLIELNAFITNLLKYNKVDVAFAGHAIFLRGDIVQLLFDKVPIIVAHNSNQRMILDLDDTYGLSRVVTPDTYEEIFFPVEGGTTVWILKKEKFANLINALKTYADTL